MLTYSRTESILKTFPRLTVGLVGDLGLERLLVSAAPSDHLLETSSEGGRPIQRVTQSASIMGTTLRSLAALGIGLLAPVSVLGDDGHGFELLRELRRLPVDPAHLLCWSDRVTPTITTLCVTHTDGAVEPIDRYEIRTRTPLADNATAAVCEHLRTVFHSSDGLIVHDHVHEADCGVVNTAVRATLQELASAHPRKRIVVLSQQRATLYPSSLVLAPASLPPMAPESAPNRSADVVVPPEQLLAAFATALISGATESEATQFCQLVGAQACEQSSLVRPAQILAQQRGTNDASPTTAVTK